MKAGRAVEIAAAWVEHEGSRLPGFHGAHLSGSLSQLKAGEDLPDYADIDIYCVMDEDRCFPQEKFSYRGALLETVAYPLDSYRSPEAVLSHPYLAHNFVPNGILADPEGFLEPLHREVRTRFAEPRWLRARYDRAKPVPLEVLGRAAEARSLNAGFPNLFRVIRLLSNLLLIAHLRAPTVRTSIRRARTLLSEAGRAALSEDLLRLSGAAPLSKERVLSLLDEAVAAFDRAVEVYRTPIPPGFNLAPAARPYLIEGSQEMVRSGDFRDAVLWISAMHWTAHQALQNDVPEDEKPRWQESVHRLYAELGLNNMNDYSRRMEEAQAVAERVVQFTDAVVYEENP